MDQPSFDPGEGGHSEVRDMEAIRAVGQIHNRAHELNKVVQSVTRGSGNESVNGKTVRIAVKILGGSKSDFDFFLLQIGFDLYRYMEQLS